jgi:hypothetical protein
MLPLPLLGAGVARPIVAESLGPYRICFNQKQNKSGNVITCTSSTLVGTKKHAFKNSID